MRAGNVIDIAAAFFDLVVSHDWKEVAELPPNEVKVLFSTVSAAGFEPKEVVPGKLVGHYRDQDGSSTGETYPINSTCPYVVISRRGEQYHATGWLDSAVRLVCRGRDQNKSRRLIVEEVQKEIERSVPLEPIQMSAEGDMLREYPPSSSYFVDHSRDGHTLSSCVGVHDHCGGWMDRLGATKTHHAIVCRSCHLRVLFPKEVKTYGELREVLTAKFVKVSA